jgi:predicted nuclease with TOPRIM domain
VINSQDKKSITGWKMTMTDKELKLLDDWIALHREIEKLEAELDTLADKLKKVSRRLYAGKSRAMLEEFSAFLDSEIKKLDRKKDRERINQLKSLQKLVAHDIYIDTLVEQDIDIEEQGTDIDLADYRGD